MRTRPALLDTAARQRALYARLHRIAALALREALGVDDDLATRRLAAALFAHLSEDA
jgi:hypothetical protein